MIVLPSTTVRLAHIHERLVAGRPFSLSTWPRCLIELQPVATVQGVGKQVDQGSHQGGQVDHPIGQRRAADLHAAALEHLGLAIQGQMIDVFVHRDQSRRIGGGQATRQGLRRQGGDVHALFAATATVLGPDVTHDGHFGRLDIDLLGGLLIDAMQGVTVIGADFAVLGQVMHDRLDGRTRWQGQAAGVAALLTTNGR